MMYHATHEPIEAMNRFNIELMPQDLARELLVIALEHLAEWPIKTPERFRNAVLGNGFFAVNPLLVGIDEDQAAFLKRMIQRAIQEGCMIDFGFIPNEIIKSESVRARTAFESGELIHPYDAWIGLSIWEGGSNGYLISQHPVYPDETLVLELYGVAIPGVGDAVILYDIVSIKIAGPLNTVMSPHRMKIEQTEKELQQRASNALDPMVTMLRLLADASIPVTRIEQPERLNRVRVKQGKFAIPEHVVVYVKDYVTAFQHSPVAKGSSKGGTHASPTAHWRKSHMRHLATGKVVKVRSTKVNWRDQEEMHRLFYRVDK